MKSKQKPLDEKIFDLLKKMDKRLKALEEVSHKQGILAVDQPLRYCAPSSGTRKIC